MLFHKVDLSRGSGMGFMSRKYEWSEAKDENPPLAAVLIVRRVKQRCLSTGAEKKNQEQNISYGGCWVYRERIWA
jgi:hypothetical protein